ncbi:MAG TPA: hypothetical protein PLD84_05225 [Chitinophagales bacterium]|nr:hypothetical protein [Chitinophagales bacterium]
MKPGRTPPQQRKLQKQVVDSNLVQDTPFEFFVRHAPSGIKRPTNKSFLRNSSKKSNLIL